MYEKADIRAFLVKPTVNDRGQYPAIIEGRSTGPLPPAFAATAIEEPERRRRVWL